MYREVKKGVNTYMKAKTDDYFNNGIFEIVRVGNNIIHRNAPQRLHPIPFSGYSPEKGIPGKDSNRAKTAFHYGRGKGESEGATENSYGAHPKVLSKELHAYSNRGGCSKTLRE